MEEKGARRKSRRGGARQARIAERAAPLPDSMRPIRPGLSGGQYKPLSPEDVKRIHDAAVRIPSEIGLSMAPASGVKSMTAYGAVYTELDDRIRYPKAVIEKALVDANRNTVLHARDPKHNLDLSDSRVHYGTAGAAVHLANIETGEYEESTLDHLFKRLKFPIAWIVYISFNDV